MRGRRFWYTQNMSPDDQLQVARQALDQALFDCLDNLNVPENEFRPYFLRVLQAEDPLRDALKEASKTKPPEIAEEYQVLAEELIGKISYFTMALARYREYKISDSNSDDHGGLK